MSPPDFRAVVRRRLSAAGADEDVIAELVAQLEDAYEAALARGVDEAEAFHNVQAEILGDAEDWRQLDAYLHTQRRPLVGRGGPSRTLASMADAWHRHVRDAARHVRRDRPYTLTVALTLSLCVAVGAAVFTIVNAVLLRPLPFPEPDRVVLMAARTAQRPGARMRVSSSYLTSSIHSDIPSYFDRRQRLTIFDEMAMFCWIDVVLETPAGVQRVRGDIGTPSLLRLIGVAPLYGRVFEDSDGVPGAERKIVLSYPLWQDLFAGDPAVVGTDVVLDGQSFTVIGVMPQGFGIFRLDAQFWLPAVYSADERADSRRGALNQYQIGRLRHGVSLEEARRQLRDFDASERQRFPFLRRIRERSGHHTSVERLQDVMTSQVRPTLTLLLAGSAIVLLLGLLNITTLTAARSRRDLRELATRQALGATWRALAAHLAAQGVIIAIIAGGGGLLMAGALLSALGRVGLHELPRGESVGVDAATALVCLAATVLAAAVIGLAPLAALAGSRMVDALRDGARERATVAGHRYLRRGLVTLQVTAAFVLTTAAALTFVSLNNVLSEDPGFTADRLLTVSFDLPQPQYPDLADARATVRRVVDAVGAIPGVDAAGVTRLLPFGGRTASLIVRPPSAPADAGFSSWNYVVSPGYFEAMQIPLMAGRYLGDGDTADTALAMVIDRNLARRLWPGGGAIGRQLVVSSAPEARPYTVVGIVADVRQASLAGADDARPAMYRSYAQAAERSFALAVRTATGGVDFDALRRSVAAVDTRLALYDARPMQARLIATMAPRRLALVSGGIFAGIALLLATVGVYAVLTYHVAERRREFGVRLVLGSSPGAIARLVMAESLAVVAAGLVTGGLAVRWLRPLLDPHLHAVDEWHTLLTGVAALLVMITVALASFGPARRASRIDPLPQL